MVGTSNQSDPGMAIELLSSHILPHPNPLPELSGCNPATDPRDQTAPGYAQRRQLHLLRFEAWREKTWGVLVQQFVVI